MQTGQIETYVARVPFIALHSEDYVDFEDAALSPPLLHRRHAAGIGKEWAWDTRTPIIILGCSREGLPINASPRWLMASRAR